MIENGKLKGRVYKCDSCGSTLFYDPVTKKLKCKHCSSLKELTATPKAFELVYSNSSELAYEPWGDAKVVRCRSCGAEFVLTEFETATKCPYCNTSNIIAIDDIPGIKPNAILPFSVGEEEAKEIFTNWLKKKGLAPRKLVKEAKDKDIMGVYIPLFTFDSDTDSTYHIRYGEHYTVTVGSGKNAHTEIRTRWFTDSGRVSLFFDDVQTEVSNKINSKELRKLKYFDTVNALKYNSQYIAGYAAERYSTGLDDAWKSARAYIDGAIRSNILNRYNYDELDYCNVSTTYSKRTYKYVLAPIWIVSYVYNKKKYRCIINGRDGTATGKAPVSPVKVTFIALAGILLVIFLVLLFYFNTR